MSDTLRYSIESVDLVFLILLLYFFHGVYRNKIWKKRLLVFKSVLLEKHVLYKYSGEKHDLWKMLALLSAPRLFYLLIYYPGNIDSDCSFCIQDFFSVFTPYSVHLGDGMISNHHPVLHTLLYGGFMYLGDCIGSQNLGVFCYMVLQVLFINGAIVLLCKKIIERGYLRYANLLLLFYTFMPIYSLWSIEMAKDQLFSGCLLWYVWQLWMIVESKGKYLTDVKHILFHGLILFLVCATKNQGIYIVLICGMVLCCFYWRRILPITSSYILSLFCFVYLYQGFLFTTLEVHPAGRQEAMGFMFQQTARYVKYHLDDVTEEERIAIDRVIPFSILAAKYNPVYQDDVKFCSREFCGQIVSEDDYKQYQKVWLEMCLKHPETYLMSMFHNCYGFFYPVHIYERMFHHSKNPIKPCVEHPEVFKYQQLSCTYYIQRGIKYVLPVLSAIPIIGLLFGFPTYTWLLLLSVLFMLLKKQVQACIVLLPALLSIAVLLVSPANEVYRYIEPIVFIAPFGFVLAIISIRKHSNHTFFFQ